MSEIEPNAAQEPVATPKAGLSTSLLAVVLVVILAILGGGGWLVYDKVIKSSDTSSALPATVLPASTFAVATVNADPSLSQKVDLFNFIHKFPGLKSKVTIGANDDARKWVIDQILKSQSCPSVSYDKDFAPWLGNHFALGGVDVGDSSPAPVAAIETSDASAATSALNKIAACSKSKDFIFTITHGYVVASNSKAHLDVIVAQAKMHPLSADASYQKWTSKLGTDGILNFYVAKAAGDQIWAAFSKDISGRVQGFKAALGDFTGMAGSLGAVGDGLQVKLAIGSKALTTGTTALSSEVSSLPADTALVLGFGMTSAMSDQVSKGFVQGFGQGFAGTGQSAPTPAQTRALIKRYTGLTVPGDLTALLGKAAVLSLGGNAPADLTSVQNPLQLPIGLKIKGDPAKIKAVIAKIEAKLGGTLADMGFTTKVSGDDFVLATNQSYANAITGSGALATDPEFTKAVPEAGKAQNLLFVRIDSAWRTAIINLLDRLGVPGASDIASNTDGLGALGIASWTEGGAAMVDVKLTTK